MAKREKMANTITTHKQEQINFLVFNIYPPLGYNYNLISYITGELINILK